MATPMITRANTIFRSTESSTKKVFNWEPKSLNVDYQRALQGELERTIDQINSIKYSRVLIVLPRQSVFVTRRAPAKASVIVKLKPGMTLDKMQVNGIIHLKRR